MPTVAPALTRKEATWLACEHKTCCHTALVVPTGRDVWRIARALDAPPWTFLAAFHSPSPTRDAFALDDEGPRYRLLLAKRPGRATKTPAPCIFLMRSRLGPARCGLGPLRPMACRCFPFEATAGVVCVADETGCRCRQWALPDADLSEEWPLLAARQAEAEQYCAVVALWNRHVAAHSGTAFDFPAFCRYLLAAYDALAEGEATAAARAVDA